MNAYLISGIAFLSPIFISDKYLNGELLGKFCVVMFIAGMILQLIQIICDEPKDFTYYCISEPTISEEEAEELLKMIEEYSEKMEKESPPAE